MLKKKQNTEIIAIVNLAKEYPGWTGEEQWAVVTDVSASLLWQHPEVQKHQPCIFLTGEQWKAIVLSLKNDEKFKTRDRRKHDLFGYEERDIDRCSSVFENVVLDEVVLHELFESIRNNRIGLTTTQQQRAQQYYLNNKTIQEIAYAENVVVSSVFKSIQLINKKIKNYFLA